MMDTHYNFAFLDERTKKRIRRALLKAVAVPGHQVPCGSRPSPWPSGSGRRRVRCDGHRPRRRLLNPRNRAAQHRRAPRLPAWPGFPGGSFPWGAAIPGAFRTGAPIR